MVWIWVIHTSKFLLSTLDQDENSAAGFFLQSYVQSTRPVIVVQAQSYYTLPLIMTESIIPQHLFCPIVFHSVCVRACDLCIILQFILCACMNVCLQSPSNQRFIRKLSAMR